MQTADVYAPFRELHPHGKFCPKCFQVLPVEAFFVKTDRDQPRLYPHCIECDRLARRERAQAIKSGTLKPRKQHREVPLSVLMDRQPIPALEVGKRYKIASLCPDGHNWDVTEGDCVGRYGKVWTLRTRAGWTTSFSPSQLAGAYVEVA